MNTLPEPPVAPPSPNQPAKPQPTAPTSTQSVTPPSQPLPATPAPSPMQPPPVQPAQQPPPEIPTPQPAPQKFVAETAPSNPVVPPAAPPINTVGFSASGKNGNRGKSLIIKILLGIVIGGVVAGAGLYAFPFFTKQPAITTKIQPTPPPGCYYQAVTCIKAPCPQALICSGKVTPTTAVNTTPVLQPTAIPTATIPTVPISTQSAGQTAPINPLPSTPPATGSAR